MKTVDVAPSMTVLALGKQGENLARAFAFDISKWVEEFGDGTAVLLHQRKGDTAPYPCTITQGDGVATWAVTSADNAVAGKGKAELQYIVNDVVVKSHTYITVTLAGLEEAGEAPDPESGWVAELLASVTAALTEAKESGESDPLYGKTVTCFGDSLMTGCEDTASDSNGFARIIKERHPGATVYNYGVNGAVLSNAAYTLAYNNGETKPKIVSAITTVMTAPDVYPGGASADYVVVDGYGNDYLCLAKYGTDNFDDVFGTPDLSTRPYWGNSGYETVYAAIDMILEYFSEVFPGAKIMFIAPYISSSWGVDIATQLVVARNVAGICAKYGAIFFDLGNTFLGTQHDITPYTSDGSLFKDDFHMTDEGYDAIADGLDACLVTGISNNYY